MRPRDVTDDNERIMERISYGQRTGGAGSSYVVRFDGEPMAEFASESEAARFAALIALRMHERRESKRQRPSPQLS